MSIAGHLKSVILFVAMISIAGCGEETYTLSHEKAQAQSGLSWEVYNQIQGGRIFLDEWPRKNAAGVRGVFNETLVESSHIVNSLENCPAGIRITRVSKHWVYGVKEEWKTKFDREEIEKCIVETLSQLPRLYEQKVKIEKHRTQKAQAERQELIARKSSWKKSEDD